MARIKYADGVTPLRNEHKGYTFKPGNYNQNVLSSQKNDRTRNVRQINRKYNMEQAIRNWRDLPAATKTAWSDYAAAYPEPCKNPDSGFLSGYQLYLKRQYYLFLNYGITEPYMVPALVPNLPAFVFNATVEQKENCLDVTIPYIMNFGIIPPAGSYVILKVLPMAIATGQFYEPIVNTVEVLESYIDGLFVSLELPADLPAVVFSVYLSKPVHVSQCYAGTKYRYMGCFTSKTFLALTDTPSSYAGMAGKVPAVKATEDGLEFVDMGGGSGGGANFGSYKAFSNGSANVQMYISSLVPGSYTHAVFKVYLTVLNPDNTFRDYMEWMLWVYGTVSILDYQTQIIVPLADPSWFSTVNAAWASGYYQIGFKYFGTLIPATSRLMFGWQLIGTYSSKTWPAALP